MNLVRVNAPVDIFMSIFGLFHCDLTVAAVCLSAYMYVYIKYDEWQVGFPGGCLYNGSKGRSVAAICG